MPSLYRIHEPPDPLKVEQFEAFIGALGFTLRRRRDGVKPKHFQKLVERISGTPVERPIAFLMLRTMQKARYDSVNMGHFGLAAASYTHFTSPIRRYPDLVVHRLLREIAAHEGDRGAARGADGELPEVGRHTSEMRAARRRGGARAAAVEKGPLHGRQGRRGVRRLHHRRRAVRLVRRARRSLRRRPGARLEAWATTTTASSKASHTLAARRPSGLPARRSRTGADRAGGHGTPDDRSWRWSRRARAAA